MVISRSTIKYKQRSNVNKSRSQEFNIGNTSCNRKTYRQLHLHCFQYCSEHQPHRYTKRSGYTYYLFCVLSLFFGLISLYLPSPVPPHIVPFDAEEQIFAGESVQLTCHVSKGDTPLTINWSFHGKDLSSHQGITTTKIGDRTSLLTLSSATASHSGEYSCHAANHAGLAVHSATVNVHGIPLYPLVVLASNARCTLASLSNNNGFLD